MKRFSLIAMFAVAVAFTGLAACKKKDDANKAAPTEATKPAAGSAGAVPAAGSAAAVPAAGSAAAVPAAGSAAMDPAMGSAAAVPPAGGAMPSDAEFEALMSKTITVVTSMADAAEKSGGDCGKLAESLEKVMSDNKEFTDTMKKYKGNPEMDSKAEAWLTANQDKMMGPAMKFAGASQKCATDAKFKDVMTKFQELN